MFKPTSCMSKFMFKNVPMLFCVDKVFVQHLVDLKAQAKLNTQLLQAQAVELKELRSTVASLQTLGAGASFNGGPKILKTTPKLPPNTALPLKTFEQVQRFEKLLQTEPAHQQNLVNNQIPTHL